MGIARGWRWFRRRPVAVQAAAWILLAAAYSVGLMVLIGGGDEESPTSASSPPPREMSSFEKRVSSMVEGVEIKGVEEQYDVPDFRKPRNATARCTQTECDIRYAVGLPGRGRILEDQRPMWSKLFSETDVQRATMEVVRNAEAAGVPPKAEEETASGAVIMTTTCDRSRKPDVDWTKRSGLQILMDICEITYSDGGGAQQRQEPVAPDDPALQEEGG